MALAASESILVDCHLELCRHRFNVIDEEMDQRVGSRIAYVLGQVDPHVRPSYR